MRLLVITAAVLAIFAISFIPQPEDKVVFLDVGQGDAILLQNSTSQVLIDGGQGMAVLQRLGEELPWFDKKIEVVVLTHPQRDHMEGLLHILERYEVGLVLLPKVAHSSQLQETWLQMIQDKNIPHRFAWTGQKLTAGDMAFKILGPFNTDAAQAAIKSDLNNASVITRIDFRDMSFLLTGDAEKRVESMLVSNTDSALLNVDILKAGHHGSNSSTHSPLIQAASPHAVVISVGDDNKFDHPRQEVLNRLGNIPLWRTDHNGSISFVHTGDQWLLKSS
jgi:competence protein ComEC